MDKQTILASLTPEVVDKFRMAIELGKWPDGRKITAEQRETCMQAVMVWEHEHLPPNERIGYIHKPVKRTALPWALSVMSSMSIIILICRTRKGRYNL